MIRPERLSDDLLELACSRVEAWLDHRAGGILYNADLTALIAEVRESRASAQPPRVELSEEERAALTFARAMVLYASIVPYHEGADDHLGTVGDSCPSDATVALAVLDRLLAATAPSADATQEGKP